jgi:MFS family permease
LALLALANILSYLDRIIINLLVQPIQQDLDINDTQFGMLQGLAFGLFYTLLALPIGRLVDSRPRKAIIVVGVATFSLFSLLSGLSRSFGHLFLARAGVGAGEATLTPAAYSLIPDLFPPARLGRGISVFTMTAFIGIGLAYIAGGTAIALVSAADFGWFPLMDRMAGWQRVFVVVALPGLLVALLLFLLLPEPVRRGRSRAGQVSIRDAIGHMREQGPLFVPMFGGFAMITLASYASAVWTPAFFIRSYGWSPAQIGLWVGLGYLVLGPLGALWAGRWCDSLTARGVRDAPLRVASLSALASGLLSALSPVMPSANLALVVLLLSVPFGTMAFPMAGTAIGLVTPNELRGQVSALYMLVINAVGLGLGPMVVGAMSDFLFTGADGVRYGLAFVNLVTAPFAFWLIRRARKPYLERRGP